MWQDIRLTSNNGHSQFLGDMFEGFLDQGIKQSEGQYFTPVPICRFILMSLPLENLIQQSSQPPKVIDYACGAGHFLNELALQIQPLLAKHKPQSHQSDYHKAIFGIEKEYRLSKIAKVSAFMYGQQFINICYGDALRKEHSTFPGIQDNSFDLLVANPPYSVRGFLETLPEEAREEFELSATINDIETANSIETFFIERAKQLLKAGGIAAIILPSSILSNGNSAYIKAREILLQYFDLVAIAEFGSGTFGKTGTNTVTLFLRRKQTSPDTAEHYRERVEQWFSHDENQSVYQDDYLVERYALHSGISPVDYKSLLRGELHGSWRAVERFIEYRKAFDGSTEIKNLPKQRWFRALSAAEQTFELDKRFLGFAQTLERDKLYYFVLACDQPNPVLVIRSPTDNKAIRQFLGYEWSASKGDEGIKLIKDGQGRHLTPLYDEIDRSNPTKINHLIAANFDRELVELPEELSDFASASRLVDLIDFSRVVFEKQIRLVAQKLSSQITKWPTEKLENIAKIINGGTPDTNSPEFWEGGDICWATLVDTKEKYLIDTQRKITSAGLKYTSLLPINTVIFSSRATIGEVCINKVPTATNQGYKNFVCDSSKVNHEYLYYLLVYLRPIFESLVPSGSKYKEINTKTIKEYEIPLPPLDIQQQIVAECQAIDMEVTEAQTRQRNARMAIEALVTAVYESTAPKLEIDKITLSIQYGLSEAMNEAGIGYKIFRMNEIEQGRMVDYGTMKYANISAEEFVKYKLNRGDLLFNRTNSIEHVGKTGLFDLDGEYCFASYLVRVVPDTKQILPLILVMMMNSAVFQQEAKGKATKSINQSNINATVMRNMKVPVPSMPEQENFVTQVEVLERTIAQAQSIIDSAPARKQAVMNNYL